MTMEKRIEKMKNEIKTQNRFYQTLAALFLIALCADTSGVLTSTYTDARAADFVHGFLLGLLIVVELFVIAQLAKNYRALKDEAQLKRLYNERHDERAQQIEALAGQKSIQIALILAIVAGLVVCYFSLEAFLGILGVVILTGIVKLCCKAYFTRTYTGE